MGFVGAKLAVLQPTAIMRGEWSGILSLKGAGVHFPGVARMRDDLHETGWADRIITNAPFHLGREGF